mgnify:CR=1 FL=1
MSTVSQPSSYLQSHHHLATNLQPMPLIQYHPQYHQAPPQLASYPNYPGACSVAAGVEGFEGRGVGSTGSMIGSPTSALREAAGFE